MKDERLYVKKKDLGISILLTMLFGLILTSTTMLWKIPKEVGLEYKIIPVLCVLFGMGTLVSIIIMLIFWIKTFDTI